MNEDVCVLTAGDLATLNRLCEEWSARGRDIAVPARRKLNHATVVFPSDLPPDVASLGSRIIYSATQRHTVTLTGSLLVDRGYLPVSTFLGLALLGRRQGDQVDVRFGAEGVQRFTLEQVLEHPEGTWPGRFSVGATERPAK